MKDLKKYREDKKKEKENLKHLKLDYKKKLKKFYSDILEVKNNKDLDNEEQKILIQDIESKKINEEKEYKNLLRIKKEEIYKLEPYFITYWIVKHKLLTILITLLLIFCTIVSMICYQKLKPNYENEHLKFRYNKEKIFIDTLDGFDGMLIVSTGGGVYESSNILIAYTENKDNLSVEQPLENLKNIYEGEISEEQLVIKNNKATIEYLLTTENDLTYKIMAKSLKDKDSFVSIVYINSGILSKEEQDLLLEVFNTIKVN